MFLEPMTIPKLTTDHKPNDNKSIDLRPKRSDRRPKGKDKNEAAAV